TISPGRTGDPSPVGTNCDVRNTGVGIMKQNLVGLTFYVEDDGLLAAMISQGDHRAIGRQRGSPYVGARRVARAQGRGDLKRLFVPLAMEQDFPAVNPISGGGDQASLIGMEDRGYSVRRRWQR